MLSNFSAITAFVGAHKLAAMLILFGAMIIEGETFLIIAGVLIHLGALSIWEVLAVSAVGALMGDFLWYSLGVGLRRVKRAEKIINGLEVIVRRLLPNFKEKPLISLILAKYIYGTNHATLILSGVIGMNLWLFARAQAAATAIWILVFVSLGYIFGQAAFLISQRVSVFLLLVLLFIVGFIAIQRAVTFYYEHRRELK